MPTGLRAALVASVLLIVSCKPHAAGGTTTSTPTSSTPHIEGGPLPTHPDRQETQARHAHTGCGLDDRLMGACTGPAPRATHPWFWQQPSPPVVLHHHAPRPRSR